MLKVGKWNKFILKYYKYDNKKYVLVPKNKNYFKSEYF